MTELEKLYVSKQAIKDHRSGVLLRLREANADLREIDDELRAVESEIRRLEQEKNHAPS